MVSKNFQKYNLIAGWVVFFIALTTYILTVEPTLSFWDCGEYIVTSAKLEVGHPPGAPFFQMVGAFFASFAPSPQQVALFVNYMSVFSSAFTILFLYFIIVNLTKKIALKTDEELTSSKMIAIIGSGVVGALTFTFSDSFWFNAVEAEVYAMAMLFMSGMFWLGIKWTDNLHTERGNKWLLLIALVVGLSFGVHFMALLTIPAIGMLYFFNSNFKKNVKNFIIANIVSITILLLIFKLILPYTLAFFGETEVFFVNSLGMPFNSGTIFAGLVMIVFFVLVLRVAHRKMWVHLQTITLCLLFVFIGFSSWLMIPIRANANVVINENSPTDARLLLAYYNLEQYPETHLFYGPMYSDRYADPDPLNPYTDEKPKYERDYKKGKYIIVNHYKNARMSPNSQHEGFLPRMWNPDHAGNYMQLTEPLKFKIRPEYANEPKAHQIVQEFQKGIREGEYDYDDYAQFLTQYKNILSVEKPSFWQNLKFLLSYQIDYMYIRYFMWNFVGRQDDIQGKMTNNHGNWISGISFYDEMRLGVPQNNLPSDEMNNKGRNVYFFIPLILGIIGLIFHYSRSLRMTWVIFVLFAFTGLALKIYLNERPFEPRERDYALVGSFFTFSIWVGMGVFAIYSKVKTKINRKVAASGVSALCLVLVPMRMAQQNWDDHDRSNRYTAKAMAQNYLDAVEKNTDAMLFSIGDNDTFPLWYMQEVENYRTDVRIINTSLLATDWYIDQMKRKAYESNPIPSQLTHDKYAYGVREMVYYSGRSENTWNIKDLITWIASDDPKTKIGYDIEGETIYYASYPTNKIRIPVNKENVLKSGVVAPKDADKIVDYIDIELPKSGIGKNRLMMLDILANNDWKRPIYFTGGAWGDEEYIWMKDYLQFDGMVYKLVPIHTPVNKQTHDMGRIDTDLMYQKVMQWNWGNMDSPSIYHDPETRRTGLSYRQSLARLIGVLIEEEKFDKAKNILDLAVKRIPVDYYGYYFTVEPMVDGYYKINETQTARKLFLQVAAKYQDYLRYYLTLNPEQFNHLASDIEFNLRRYGSLLAIISANKDDDFYNEQEEIFKNYIEKILGSSNFQEEESFSEPLETPKSDTI